MGHSGAAVKLALQDMWIWGLRMSSGGSAAVREGLLQQSMPQMMFQTIGRTYTKAPWSREDRACVRQCEKFHC